MIDSRRRGKKTPTLFLAHAAQEAECGKGAKTGSACLATIRRSVLECRENTRYPGQVARSPRLHAVSTR